MKKAIIMSQTVMVVIAALTMMILFMLMYQIGVSQNAQTPDQLCKISVEARATAKRQTTETLIPLKCQRDHLIVKDQSTEELNVQLLNEIKDCIYKMGDGQVDFSKSGNLFSEEHCVVCSEIEAASDSKIVQQYRKESFGEYLAKTRRSPDQTYRQFFDTSKVEVRGESKNQAGLFFKIPEEFDPSKKHILFFKFIPKTKAQQIYSWVTDKEINVYPSVMLEEYPDRAGEFNLCKKNLN